MSSVQILTDYERTQLSLRQPLPDRYLRLSDEDMDARIAAAKAALGRRVLILGHHYQRDEVIKFADVTGDSLKLAQYAATHHEAEFVVFCGVHFMAESANVLGAPHQQVILPDLAAGCSMADMAAIDQLEICWDEMRRLGATNVIPVTYINSSAAIKAFCGEHGGIVCTSTNAAKVMAWAWDRAEKVLMLPDQHLGRNTGFKMGVPLDEMVVWDPEAPYGGHGGDGGRGAEGHGGHGAEGHGGHGAEGHGGVEAFHRARLILWKGHCSVHTRFSVKQIDQFRAQYPGGKVIVHPECTFDVVQAADQSGSTEFIIRTVKNSPPGSIWAVGTEIHLVNRLANDVAPDRLVVSLDAVGCLCSTMFRVSPNHLLWALEGLVEGEVRNPIVVPEPTRGFAKLALDRMLEAV